MTLCWSAGTWQTENTEHHDETEDALNGQHLERTFGGIHAEINVGADGIKRTVGHAADQHQSKIHDEQKRASDGHSSKNNVETGDASETQQFQ